MVASLLETVFITNIQFSSNQYSTVPHWLSVLVLQYIAVVVCLRPKKKSNKVTVFFNPSSTGIILIDINCKMHDNLHQLIQFTTSLQGVVGLHI